MEKVFRDPVHNLMRFDMERDRLVLRLIDAREVQRLRRIRQMGVSEFVYPGATHTRFAHSLGVTHLMRRVIERMDLLRKDPQYERIARSLDAQRELLLAAALLHDVGHFPFSHLLEEVIDQDHEAWSVRLVLAPETEVHQLLAAADPSYPEQVARILQRTFRPSYAVKLISSQLDVDRMDYLLRDSLYAGVGYGRFDLDWLLHSLRIVQVDGDDEVAIEAPKGLRVAEAYLLARYYMYQQVYHHKTERAAGALLLVLLRRAREVLQAGRLQDTPEPVRRLLQDPQTLSLEDFLKLDDVLLGRAIALWSEAADPLLADLAGRFLNRRVFKTVPLSARAFLERREALETLARARGFEPRYYLVMDSAFDSPYRDRYLLPREGEAGEQVLLVDRSGRLSELSDASDLIRSLRNRPVGVERLCFPEELREGVLKALEG